MGNSSTFKLAGQLEEAFNQFGTSMMTDDFAGKLLAYLLEYGGGNEAVTMHTGLNAGIAIAQQKFNLKGGETPNIEGVIIFNKYLKELKKDEMATVWLWEIYLRYDLDTSGLKSECPENLAIQYVLDKKSQKKSKK